MTNLALDYPRPVGVNQLPPGVGVLRYWPKKGGSRVVVGLTRAEITALQDAGRPFATIYEAPDPGWMAGGYGAGQDAARWLAGQFEATNYTPRAVYLAADSPDLSTQAVNACLDGAVSVLGKGIVGMYGFLPQLKSAYAGGHASWWWLTGRYVTSADYPWIHVYQCQGSQPAGVPTTLTVGGQETDVNMIFRPDWGQSILEDDVSWSDQLADWDPPNTSAEARVWLIAGRKAAGEAANTAARVEAQLAAVSGTLTANQAALLAAISDRPTQIDLTTEQMQQLLSGMSEASKQGMRELLIEGVGTSTTGEGS